MTGDSARQQGGPTTARSILANLSVSFWAAILTTIASCALLWSVNAAWRTDSLVALEVLEHLRLARTELLRGYLLTDRLLGGEAPLTEDGRCAYFEQAAWRADNALAALEPMREDASFQNGYARIAARLGDYHAAIESLGRNACAGTGEPGTGVDVLELGKGMADAEKLFGQIASDIHTRLRVRALRQDGYVTALIVGWAGLMTFVSAAAGVAGLRRRQAETSLRESEERFRLLVESASNAIFLQREGRFAYANPASARLFGADGPDALIGLPIIERIHPDDRESVAERIRSLNEDLHDAPWNEERILRLDGTPVVVEAAATPLDVKGARGALVQMHDVSARKQAEEELRASLREKEMLLREVHHRVKNSLQIILSLMRLQEADIASEAERERFARLGHRIRSMALIHGQLYKTGGLGYIDMGGYAAALLAQLEATFNRKGKVRLESELEEVRLDIERAVPLGLLMNELVTNAFKHAFDGREDGLLRVTLARTGEGEARLTVCDDGPGMPQEGDLRAGSLGMTLVAGLTEQLQGSLIWLPGQGATAQIDFPL